MEIAEDVHEYLIKHLNERITIETLSKIFLINQTTLKETFKNVYGTSLASHINNHRMEKAELLMKDDNKSIMDIALAVGFSSQSRFSEAFKKHFGASPAEYRKKH